MPRNGVKDLNKASSVEEYVGTLLSRIQPAPASEDRRSIVAEYVKAKISQAFQPAVEASFPARNCLLSTQMQAPCIYLGPCKNASSLRPLSVSPLACIDSEAASFNDHFNASSYSPLGFAARILLAALGSASTAGEGFSIRISASQDIPPRWRHRPSYLPQ